MTPTIVRHELHGPNHYAVVVTYTNRFGSEEAAVQLYHHTEGMVWSRPFTNTDNAVTHFGKFIAGLSA